MNFPVTPSSLQSQCLNIFLKAEGPEIDKKISDIIKLQGEFKVKLRQLEDQLGEAGGAWAASRLVGADVQAADMIRTIQDGLIIKDGGHVVVHHHGGLLGSLSHSQDGSRDHAGEVDPADNTGHVIVRHAMRVGGHHFLVRVNDDNSARTNGDEDVVHTA